MDRYVSAGGFNARYRLTPFLSGEFHYERGYFKKSERLSWSHHSSFALSCSSEFALPLTNLYGHLARFLGMEVIDTYSYFYKKSGEFNPDFLNDVVEDSGYFYGCFPSERLYAITERIKKLFFIQSPIEVLAREGSNNGSNNLSEYLLCAKNWQRFYELSELKNSENCYVIPFELLAARPVEEVVNTILYLCGHEPHALVQHAVTMYLTPYLHLIEKKQAVDNLLSEKLWGEHSELMQDLGYDYSNRDVKYYNNQSNLERMI